jgi:hypothetical protein
MADKRIRPGEGGLDVTATFEDDDHVVVDGQTAGTRAATLDALKARVAQTLFEVLEEDNEATVDLNTAPIITSTPITVPGLTVVQAHASGPCVRATGPDRSLTLSQDRLTSSEGQSLEMSPTAAVVRVADTVRATVDASGLTVAGAVAASGVAVTASGDELTIGSSTIAGDGGVEIDGGAADGVELIGGTGRVQAIDDSARIRVGSRSVEVQPDSVIFWSGLSPRALITDEASAITGGAARVELSDDEGARLHLNDHGVRVTSAGVTTIEHDETAVVTVDDGSVNVTGDLSVSGPVRGRVPVITVSTDTHTPGATDSGAIYRCTHADGCAVTIPDDLPVGWTASWIQEDADDEVTFVAGGTGDLETIAGVEPETAEQWAMATVTVIAAGVALLTGQLAETP